MPTSHADSQSRTLLEVRGDGLHFEVQLQTLSLIEDSPELDRNGDKRLDSPELQDAGPAIAGYLTAGLRLDGAPLPTPQDVHVTWLGRVGDDVWQGNQVRIDWFLPGVARPSRYGLDWFTETSPGHRDRLQLRTDWHVDAVTEIRAGAETVELGYGPHWASEWARQALGLEPWILGPLALFGVAWCVRGLRLPRRLLAGLGFSVTVASLSGLANGLGLERGMALACGAICGLYGLWDVQLARPRSSFVALGAWAAMAPLVHAQDVAVAPMAWGFWALAWGLLGGAVAPVLRPGAERWAMVALHLGLVAAILLALFRGTTGS
ncbi:MAG: hypothetical protein R3F33_08465 [Planctomycetota bacterium]